MAVAHGAVVGCALQDVLIVAVAHVVVVVKVVVRVVVVVHVLTLVVGYGSLVMLSSYCILLIHSGIR